MEKLLQDLYTLTMYEQVRTQYVSSINKKVSGFC